MVPHAEDNDHQHHDRHHHGHHAGGNHDHRDPTAPRQQHPNGTAPEATTSTRATYNSLAAIGQRVQADAIANAEPSLISAYAWNVYLGRNANVTPPDPGAIFADAASPMTFAAYWSGTSAYLAANLGMSGLGRVPRIQQVRGGWIA